MGSVEGHDEPIRLSAAEESELFEAMEEIRRGEYEDGDDLLKLNELRQASGLSSADLKLSNASPETSWRRDEIYGDDGR